MRIHADHNRLSKLVAAEMKYFNRRFAMSMLSACTAVIALLSVLLSLFSYVSSAADPVNQTYLNLSIGLVIALIAAYFTYRIMKWGESASYSLVMSFTAFSFLACAFGGFLLSRPVWLNEIQNAHTEGFSIYTENVVRWSFWVPLMIAAGYFCASFVHARSTYVRGGWGYNFFIFSPALILPILALFLRINNNRDTTIEITSIGMTIYMTAMLSLGVKYAAKAIMHQVLLHMPQDEKAAVVRNTARQGGSMIKWWEHIFAAPYNTPSSKIKTAIGPSAAPLPAEMPTAQANTIAFEPAKELPAPVQQKFKDTADDIAATALAVNAPQETAILSASQAQESESETSGALPSLTGKKMKADLFAASGLFTRLRGSKKNLKLDETEFHVKEEKPAVSERVSEANAQKSEPALAVETKTAESVFTGKNKKAIHLDETEFADKEKTRKEPDAFKNEPARQDSRKPEAEKLKKETEENAGESVFAGKRSTKNAVQIDAAELEPKQEKMVQNKESETKINDNDARAHQKKKYHAEKPDINKSQLLHEQDDTKTVKNTESNAKVAVSEQKKQAALQKSQKKPAAHTHGMPEAAHNSVKPAMQVNQPQQTLKNAQPNKKQQRKKKAANQNTASAKPGSSYGTEQQAHRAYAGHNEAKNSGRQESAKNIYKTEPQAQTKKYHANTAQNKKKNKPGAHANQKEKHTEDKNPSSGTKEKSEKTEG